MIFRDPMAHSTMTKGSAVWEVTHQKAKAVAATMIVENDTIRITRNVKLALLRLLQRAKKIAAIKTHSRSRSGAVRHQKLLYGRTRSGFL
jgi:hypothetical protein